MSSHCPKLFSIGINPLILNISFSYMTENLHENVDILFNAHNTFLEEEFEDTKGASRIGISKKNRQHNDQEKKY